MTAELFRDAWGVPHLRASDHLELAEAQGRVTALDRGWQIEVDRWRAQGRLAERIGAAGVTWDVFAHRTRIDDTAQRVYAGLAAGDREWVDAYVRGVNAGLLAGVVAGSRPVEIGLLDEHHGDGDDSAEHGGGTPHEHWEPWAPIGVLLVAHALFSSFPHLLWNEHVARVLGEDAVPLFAESVEGGAPSSGSNAWALHGSRTASGRPLLAGDPHRLLELPSVYQQIRLSCPDFDVVGLAFPGVPGIPHFGHTGHAAWGVTNAMAHHVEVFRERLRREGDVLSALGPDGWEPAARSTAHVRVRGGQDVVVEVVETARGPVLADLGAVGAADSAGAPDGAAPHPAGAMIPSSVVETRALSLRAPVRVEADAGISALLPLLRARTAADVTGALAQWVDPVNRVVVADTAGTVLGVVAGRLPERPAGERVRPHDAWSAAARPAPWLTLPPPRVVADVAVDANDRPREQAWDLGSAYAPPHRAERVRSLLDERRGERLDAQDMEAIHADTLLPCTDLIGRVADVDGLTPGAAALRSRLLAWDRHMDTDSVPAAELAAVRSALVVRISAHPALRALHAPHGTDAALDPWFAVGPRVAHSLERLLASPLLGIDAAAEVRAALEEVTARPMTNASWGDAHRLHALHVLAEVPGCAAPTVPAVPLGGDTDCVRSTSSVPGTSDLSWRGSVARWVWDLDDRERSRWIVPFGTSGDPRSPHFTDQLPLWAAATTVEVVTDWTHLTREDLP